MKAEKAKIVTVSVPTELARRFAEFARQERRPLSWTAVDAFREYLERHAPQFPVEPDPKYTKENAF